MSKEEIRAKFMRAQPEWIAHHLGLYTSRSEEMKERIRRSNGLSPEEINSLLEGIDTLSAFAEYVIPLIEPIAYCTLDEVQLIRKDSFARIREIIQEIECMREIANQYLAMDGAKLNSFVSELDKINVQFNHPYQ